MSKLTFQALSKKSLGQSVGRLISAVTSLRACEVYDSTHGAECASSQSGQGFPQVAVPVGRAGNRGPGQEK